MVGSSMCISGVLVGCSSLLFRRTTDRKVPLPNCLSKHTRFNAGNVGREHRPYKSWVSDAYSPCDACLLLACRPCLSLLYRVSRWLTTQIASPLIRPKEHVSHANHKDNMYVNAFQLHLLSHTLSATILPIKLSNHVCPYCHARYLQDPCRHQ